jgi:methylmalonyl-CoA/ethylmalonyl-CoA epimerase
MLGPIAQIALPVHDLDRAIECYRDRLGLPLLFRVPGLAFFDLHGIRLMLSRPEGVSDAPGSVLYFKVDDLSATWTMLGERRVDLVDAPHLIAKMPDHDLWMAFFKDSEGNQLAAMSEVRPPAPRDAGEPGVDTSAR